MSSPKSVIYRKPKDLESESLGLIWLSVPLTQPPGQWLLRIVTRTDGTTEGNEDIHPPVGYLAHEEEHTPPVGLGPSKDTPPPVGPRTVKSPSHLYVHVGILRVARRDVVKTDGIYRPCPHQRPLTRKKETSNPLIQVRRESSSTGVAHGTRRGVRRTPQIFGWSNRGPHPYGV